jgi:hypothetical protein
MDINRQNIGDEARRQAEMLLKQFKAENPGPAE